MLSKGYKNIFFIFLQKNFPLTYILLFIEESLSEGFTLLSPLFGIYSFILVTFFKLINMYSHKVLHEDSIQSTMINKNITSFSFVLYIIVLIPFLMSLLLNIKGPSRTYWSEHLFLSNYNVYLIFFVFILSFCIIFIFYNIFFQGINLLKEYYFSSFLVLLFFPYLFIINNFFSFLFFLEYINTLILLKLIASRLNKTSITDQNSYFTSKKFISLIFYQFWSTFFSNMLLFYFFVGILCKTGTTCWYLLNLIIFETSFSFFTEWGYITLLSLSFILSIFLKLGVSPLHLFKVEVYDGLPFISILFYTTFYVSVFFVYLVYIFSFLCFSIFYYLTVYILYFVSLGFCYTVFNALFNIQLLKTFFALSTVLNVSLFFIVFSVIMN
jgi:hypothetical protein